MDVIELPQDLFLQVISYLSPRELIRCRRVCRQWRGALTSDEVSQLLLRWNFPDCREMRLIEATGLLALDKGGFRLLAPNFRVEVETVAREPTRWAATFATVAARYHHLRRARPRSIQKLRMPLIDHPNQDVFRWICVEPWERYLSFNGLQGDFHYPDPIWWYSREDAVLVYPTEPSNDTVQADASTVLLYRLFDPATNQHTVVPFNVRNKYIRRVRLAQGVLIFEWAEPKPYRQPYGQKLHHHFATAFDVARIAAPLGSPGPKWIWTVKFRSEFKFHSQGFRLNCRERFLSAHTATHYVVYSHRDSFPHSLELEPIEQLAVWDISSPDPPPSSGNPASRQAPSGPVLIRHMNRSELSFYGICQGLSPQLRHLALDKHNFYFIVEEHRWAQGLHTTDFIGSPPRIHVVKSTGIPIVPFGHASHDVSNCLDRPVFGPRWVDICGADGDVHLYYCRHVSRSAAQKRDLGYFLRELRRVSHRPNLHLSLATRDTSDSSVSSSGHNTWSTVDSSEALSSDGGGSGSGSSDNENGSTGGAVQLQQTTFPWDWLDPRAIPWPWSESDTATPPSRWPGYAPCWRHEEFPYLTISEMVDFAAGVRISARRCFMLECMSVHLRPALWVTGPPCATDHAVARTDDGMTTSSDSSIADSDSWILSVTSGWEEPEVPRSAEAQFPDHLYSELMARGTIAGDERWVVGQGADRGITIVRF